MRLVALGGIALCMLIPSSLSLAADNSAASPSGTKREAPKYKSAKPDRCKQACRLAAQCKSNPADPDLSSICSDGAQLGELNTACAKCSKPTPGL